MFGDGFDWLGGFVDRWSIYLFISTSLLPFMVWDIHTDQYRGFSHPPVLGYMLVMIPVGMWYAWIRGQTRGEIFVTVIVGCAIMYALPQAYAEFKHKRKHGVWLFQRPAGGAQRGDAGDEGDENGGDDDNPA
ncbi:MAG: hypothetical protein OXE80_03895 [Gammaproteobacteria bacterium]|nr:hypothetical protein [Gammaproteobacteria bacterium]